VQAWIEDRPDHNIGLRPPQGVVGLDVDAYGDKRGRQTLEALEAELGPISRRRRTTSRDDGVSGIYWLTVPLGLTWPGELGPGIEIVQYRHRYGVAPPSIHPDTGRPYGWVDESGDVLDDVPRTDDLDAMPPRWVAAFGKAAEPEPDRGPAAQLLPADCDEWLAGLPSGRMCGKVERAWEAAVRDLDPGSGRSRHDVAMAVTFTLVRSGAEGHPGALDALQDLWDVFRGAVADDPSRDVGAEWARMVIGAISRSQHVERVDRDPCISPFGPGLVMPPAAGSGAANGPTAPPKAASKAPAPAGRRVVAISASGIEPEEVTWLYDSGLAVGTLALLAGREGLGKSLIALWVAARITRGELPGARLGTPHAVGIVATEDDWPRVIVPRLMAMGADLDLIFRVEAVIGDNETPLDVRVDFEGTRRLITEHGIVLLILDPLMSRLGGALDTHRDNETRLALEPLAKMAQGAGCVVWGLIHHNKNATTDDLNAVMGSKAFTAVPRTVLTVVADPEDPEKALFGLSKNNLGPTHVHARRFHVVTRTVHTRTGDGGVRSLKTAGIEWLDLEPVGGTIRDAMAQATEPIKESKLLDAWDFVSRYLRQHGGGAASDAVLEAAKAAGHSRPTVYRAVKDRINSDRSGYGTSAMWILRD
jgi:hypothetical protein